MVHSYQHLRVEYDDAPLLPAELTPEPLALLRDWLAAAAAAGVGEPNGMHLATCDRDGQPHGRVVLLKEIDARGLVFFTNKLSDKGEQLTANPRAALTFWWQAPRQRQVRVLGAVEHVHDGLAETYFHARPKRAQLCSAASPQSCAVADRQQLEDLVNALAQQVGDGEVPRPPQWGGYRVVPAVVEFWQGREGRLHDRFRYRLDGGTWRTERLAP